MVGKPGLTGDVLRFWSASIDLLSLLGHGSCSLQPYLLITRNYLIFGSEFLLKKKTKTNFVIGIPLQRNVA